MTTEEKLNKALNLLKEVELTLTKWAIQSTTGGWSTHQVTPQRELASRIREFSVSIEEDLDKFRRTM